MKQFLFGLCLAYIIDRIFKSPAVKLNPTPSKITSEMGVEILKLYKDGFSPSDLAKRFNVPTSAIRKFLSKHIKLRTLKESAKIRKTAPYLPKVHETGLKPELEDHPEIVSEDEAEKLIKGNPLMITDKQKKNRAGEGELNEGIAYYEIDPEKFLLLTSASPTEINMIKSESNDLEYFNLRREEYELPPTLFIDSGGNVLTHEGRHRAAAIIANDESLMTIVITAFSSGFPKEVYGPRFHRELMLPRILRPQNRKMNYVHVIDFTKVRWISSAHQAEEKHKFRSRQ